MKVILILCGLMAISSAAVIQGRAYETELRALLEKVRDKMDVGYPEYNVPPLDPFHADEVVYNFDIPELDLLMNVDFKNILGKNLSGFVVNVMNLNMLRLRLDFDVTVPLLNLTADHYKLDGEVSGIKLFGEGSANVRNFNTGIKGNATITIRNGFVVMTGFECAVSIEKMETDIQGFMGGGQAGEIMNDIIADFVPALLASEQERFSQIIAGFVIPIANERMQNLTLSDAINIITGGGGTSTTTTLFDF